jgi:hypothetical protein
LGLASVPSFGMADWRSGMQQDQQHQNALCGMSVPDKITTKLLIFRTFHYTFKTATNPLNTIENYQSPLT